MRNIFWLAMVVTLAGLFRSDFGVYCTIAATVAVVVQPFYKAGGLKRALILWGEIFLIALPYLLFLMLKGGLGHYFSVYGNGIFLLFPIRFIAFSGGAVEVFGKQSGQDASDCGGAVFVLPCPGIPR